MVRVHFPLNVDGVMAFSAYNKIFYLVEPDSFYQKVTWWQAGTQTVLNKVIPSNSQYVQADIS
jgi:hypothetical protein